MKKKLLILSVVVCVIGAIGVIAPMVYDTIKTKKPHITSEEINKKINNVIMDISQKSKEMKTQIGQSILGKEEKMSIEILFQPNSDIISQTSENSLQKIILFYKKHPKSTIQIQGFTDKSGNDIINVPLSIRRASAVKNYLINNGCDINSEIGYGSSEDARKVVVTIRGSS